MKLVTFIITPLFNLHVFHDGLMLRSMSEYSRDIVNVSSWTNIRPCRKASGTENKRNS